MILLRLKLEFREDEKATINKVSVVGNDKTNDYVIFRELRVKPGSLFSRDAIIRSIREIGQLGFFDTNVTPDVNQIIKIKLQMLSFSVIEKEEVRLNFKVDMEEVLSLEH